MMMMMMMMMTKTVKTENGPISRGSQSEVSMVRDLWGKDLPNLFAPPVPSSRKHLSNDECQGEHSIEVMWMEMRQQPARVQCHTIGLEAVPLPVCTCICTCT